MRDPLESELLENEGKTQTYQTTFSCICKLWMPPENGRQEVTLFLSIAACELFKAFNGLQLAQAEEANYKTLREKSEEPSTLEQICNLGRNDEVLPLFP